MPRLGRRGLDLLPQPRDVRVDGARKDGWIVAPHVMQQRFASDHGIRVIEKIAKDAKLALGQIERRAAFRRLILSKIEVDVAEGHHVGRELTMRPPDYRLQP